VAAAGLSALVFAGCLADVDLGDTDDTGGSSPTQTASETGRDDSATQTGQPTPNTEGGETVGTGSGSTADPVADSGTATGDDTDAGGLVLPLCLREPDCVLECDDGDLCFSEDGCFEPLLVALRDRTPGTTIRFEQGIGGAPGCISPTVATILTSGQLLIQAAVKACSLSGVPIEVCELHPPEYFQACIDGGGSCDEYPGTWFTTCETLEPAPTTCEDLPQ